MLDAAHQPRYYIWDGDQMLAELNGDGTLSDLSIWGPDGLNSRLANQDQQNQMWPDVVGYAYDPFGNRVERASYDSISQGFAPAIDHEVYDAYGKLMYYSLSSFVTPVDDVTHDPYGYKGQDGYYTDAEGQALSVNDNDANNQSGFIYCEHRFYSPDEARWITRDPAGLEGGVNVYEYCGDEPVMTVDPSGLQARHKPFPGQGAAFGSKRPKSPSLANWKRVVRDQLRILMKQGYRTLYMNMTDALDAGDISLMTGLDVKKEWGLTDSWTNKIQLDPWLFEAIDQEESVGEKDDAEASRIWLRSVLLHEYVHTQQGYFTYLNWYNHYPFGIDPEDEAWGYQVGYIANVVFAKDTWLPKSRLAPYDRLYNDALKGWSEHGGPPYRPAPVAGEDGG